MSVRAIDENNDITFGKGKSNYQFGSEEIKQNVKTRIQSWKNDCFFALDEGADWNLYLENGDADLLAEDIKRIIVQTFGVGQLLDFDYSLVDRVFKANYRIVDIYSEAWNDTVENITL